MIGRLSAIALTMFLAVSCASAPRTRSFVDLPKYVDSGNTIHLTETSGATATGTLGALSATSLTIVTGGQSRDVPQGDVRRLARQERRTLRGAMIGLGIGFGVGLIGGMTVDSGNPLVDAHAGGASVLSGVILGTAVGAAIGAFVKVNRTVYEAPGSPTAP